MEHEPIEFPPPMEPPEPLAFPEPLRPPEPLAFPEPLKPPEPAVYVEIERESIEATMDELPGTLGYVESARLLGRRQDWVQAMRQGAESTREFAIAYQEEAEAADAEHLARFRQGRERVTGWMLRDRRADDEASEENVLAEAAGLGFVETDELRAARVSLDIAHGHDPHALTGAVLGGLERDYHKLANIHEAHYGAKFQIGLLIAKATVQRDAGKLDYYAEDLEGAWEYARQERLDEVADAIAREIESLDH